MSRKNAGVIVIAEPDRDNGMNARGLDWDPNGFVNIDPGGTLWGPGPYFKIPFKEAGEEDEGCRSRVYCPLGYPGDTLKVMEVQAVFMHGRPAFLVDVEVVTPKKRAK